MTEAAVADDAPPGRGFTGKALIWVEKVGNRVPNPAILFIGLIVLVIALSQILDWANAGATSQIAEPPAAHVESTQNSYDPPAQVDGADYKITTERVEAKGLLTSAGIRFMFTTFVPNFLGFAAVGVILVAMIGVGIAEYSGLIGALIRKLVAISSPGSLTYIIVFVGIVSSVASDAGYLVLIPLAAAAFISVGRHPLAGIAAGFGAVSAAFSVNILLTPADGVVTDIANEAAKLVDPSVNLDLVANLWFGIVSTIFLTVVIALITTKIVEPRLGAWDRDEADEEEHAREEGPAIDAEAEARGLRWALYALLAVLAVVLALTLPPGAPLRNPDTGDIIGDSPLMSSLIVIISAAFLAAGLASAGPRGRSMVAALASGVVPAAVAGAVAAMAIVVLGVMRTEEAYRAISWTTVVLIAGLIPISTALQDTGAADDIASLLLDVVGDAGPRALLAGLFVVAALLGIAVSNTATALILLPVGVSAAATLDVSVRPVLMTLAVACAAAYLTPISTPGNLMIMAPGGYRFGDYWRFGLVMLAVSFIVAVVWVPVVWPF